MAVQQAVSIKQVEEELLRGWRGWQFAPAIEPLFLVEYLKGRARMTPVWASLGTLFYLFAIIGDFSMISDMTTTIVSLRIGVFLPYAIAIIFIMRRWPSAGVFDALAFGVGFIGIALPMGTLVFSSSAHLFIYQTGSVATLAFFSIVLRPRFPTVVGGLAIMIAVQLLTTRLNGSFDAVTYSGIVSFYVTLGVFLALSAYFAEQVDRQNFLHRLRGELLQQDLRQLSELDPMTGLYNRLVLTRMRHTLWEADRPDRSVALIMLDIDNFKLFNDVHGHVDGDDCIRRVGDLVQTAVGEDGIVCRYGGEELLILMPDARCAEAAKVAEAIRRSIEDAQIVNRGLDDHGVVTASLGVTADYTGARSLKELILQADAALYDAKRAGRNRVNVDWSDPLPLLRRSPHFV